MFDWDTFVALAGVLKDRATDLHIPEACYRSSISRSYYGVFCKLRNYLRRKRVEGLYSGGSAVHQLVIDAFKFCNNKIKGKKQDIKVIGVRLEQLRDYRNNADYDDEYEGVDDVVLDALGDAQAILRNCDSLH